MKTKINQKLNNKVYIVTGANAGIGKATSALFAEKGATVVMACRSEKRGNQALDEIQSQTGNANINLMIVDMSSFGSIRKFVNEFLSKFDRLDGLINNAAHFDLSQKTPLITDDKVESVFATNHLGPFLLTKLLLPILEKTKNTRVINISSMGLLTYPMLKIQFDDLTTSENRKYKVPYAYYHSKLAHVMFTRELARRVEGTTVTVNAIRVPAVQVDISRYPNMPKFLIKVYSMKQKFSISPEQMAEVYLSLGTENKYQGINGKYFNEKGNNVKFPKNSDDVLDCKKLWDISEELVK